MTGNKIVSIGLLTEQDLERLGNTFTAHFPVTDDCLFDDLLAQLDTIEASPLGEGISVLPKLIQ